MRFLHWAVLTRLVVGATCVLEVCQNISRYPPPQTCGESGVPGWCGLMYRANQPLRVFGWALHEDLEAQGFHFTVLSATKTVVTVVNTVLAITTIVTNTPTHYPTNFLNSEGKRVETVTYESDMMVDGDVVPIPTVFTTVMTYPTDLIIWPFGYVYAGVLRVPGPAPTDPSTCVTYTESMEGFITDSPQPTNPADLAIIECSMPRLPITDISGEAGLAYGVGQLQFPGWFNLFSDLLPGRPEITQCEPEGNMNNRGGFTKTDWITVTAQGISYIGVPGQALSAMVPPEGAIFGGAPVGTLPPSFGGNQQQVGPAAGSGSDKSVVGYGPPGAGGSPSGSATRGGPIVVGNGPAGVAATSVAKQGHAGPTGSSDGGGKMSKIASVGTGPDETATFKSQSTLGTQSEPSTSDKPSAGAHAVAGGIVKLGSFAAFLVISASLYT